MKVSFKMANPNYPILTHEQKRRKQAIRNWKRSQKQLVEYCYWAQVCNNILKPYAEQHITIPDEREVISFDSKPICDFLFKDDDKYWDDLDANRLISESVAEFCLA